MKIITSSSPESLINGSANIETNVLKLLDRLTGVFSLNPVKKFVSGLRKGSVAKDIMAPMGDMANLLHGGTVFYSCTIAVI